MSSHINSSTRIKDDDGPRDLPKPTVASAENPIPDQKPEKPAKLLNALNRVRVPSIKACEACRKRKMRCSGAENPPCNPCRLRGTECIFEKPTLETQNNPKQGISAREKYLPRTWSLSMGSPLSQWSGGTSRHVEGFNPPARPPPAANPQLWSWFRSVGEHDRSEITADELQRALCNGSWTPLDLDTVYMLMDLIDTDRSDTVGFQEFVRLWHYISKWQIVFQRIDQDQVGSIDDAELGYALRDLGYNLSPQLLSLLEQKYAYGAYGEINFNGFVRACVSVKMLTDTFQRLDTDRDGWIKLDYPSFLRVVLSAPAETNVDYTTFAGSNTERGAIPEEASVTTNVATSSSPQRLSIPDSSPFESHYSSGFSASHCQSQDVVKKAKTLCDSVMIFQQSAFDIAELAELRMYSFMAWSTSIEGQHELQDSAEYDSFEAEMAAHEKMESFLSYKEIVYSRLNRDLELVVALLAFLSEGISQPGLPEDILLAFIMAWIILCDSTEVTIATTPKQRQTLNGSFLKALRYDVTEVSNAMSSSSSRMVSESRAGNQDFLDFDSIYKSLVVAFTEIVQPFLGSEYSELELETAAPPRATLIKAAILHSPWLGGDQGLIKSLQDLSHKQITGATQKHKRTLSSTHQGLLKSDQTSSGEVMVPLLGQKGHQRGAEEAKTQSTVMDDVEMSDFEILDKKIL